MFEHTLRKVLGAVTRLAGRSRSELPAACQSEAEAEQNQGCADAAVESIAPVLLKEPVFIGKVGSQPKNLRGARMLTVGFLAADGAPSSHLPALSEIRARVAPEVARINAVWSDRYLADWVVVSGTRAEFLTQGVFRPSHLVDDGNPFVAIETLRFEWAPTQKGRRPYSSTEYELHQAIGAVLYQYNRLAAGFAHRSGFVDPSYGELAGFEDLATAWQGLREVLFSDLKRKGEDWDATIWRRFKRDLGAPRMRALHGEEPNSEELQVGLRLVEEGRDLACNRRWRLFSDTPRSNELLEELKILVALLHRASRQKQGVTTLTLDPQGYPLTPSASAMAELRGGRAGMRYDQRPDALRLTKIAFSHRFDPTFLFGDLEFLGAHFALAMAAGVAARRGEYIPDADAHYGLIGLMDTDADKHLNAEILEARAWLRFIAHPELVAAAALREPPPAISLYDYRRYRDFVRGKGRAAMFYPKPAKTS